MDSDIPISRESDVGVSVIGNGRGQCSLVSLSGK